MHIIAATWKASRRVNAQLPRSYPEAHYCRALAIELQRHGCTVQAEPCFPSWYTDSAGVKHQICRDRGDILVTLRSRTAIIEVKHCDPYGRVLSAAREQLLRHIAGLQ